MTRIEQLEKQKMELEARRKKVAHELAAAKKKEAARVAQEERAKEQAEALEFFRFCKNSNIDAGGKIITIWQWVMDFKQYNQQQQNNKNSPA